MCGRFTLTAPEEIVAETFGLDEVPSLTARYNIAPTQSVAVVRPRGAAGTPHLGLMRWGVTRSRPGASRGLLINVRSEGLRGSRGFRDAFARRRCLVPADGFFEWTTEAGAKRPHYIRLSEGRLFALAGLWEPGAEDGCVVLTTEPNELVRPLHDRMPVILAPEDHARWLDTGSSDPEALNRLCRPYPAELMTAWPVGRTVNDSRQDTPECVRPEERSPQ